MNNETPATGSPEHRLGDPGDADVQHRATHSALWDTAVRTLTVAARLRHPVYGPLDFADFLASVLAAAAANLGSVEATLAGRPGSWEADLVRQLLCGTVGYDPDDLARYRTEPVNIHLNVHRLMCEQTWSRPGNQIEDTPYDQEISEVYQRHDDLPAEDYNPDTEAEEAAQVTAKWTNRYSAYADAFTAAVLAEAARITDLRVPVRVQANIDPDAGPLDGPAHPDELDPFDPLLWRLWQAALRIVPLPGQDDYPG